MKMKIAVVNDLDGATGRAWAKCPSAACSLQSAHTHAHTHK